MDQADPAQLLVSPHDGIEREAAIKPDLFTIAGERHRLSPAVPGVGDGKPFVNEPFRDFSRHAARESFGQSVRGATVPKVANDRSPEDARRAVDRAFEYFPKWRDTDPRTRAGVLTRAAAIMRQRRDGLCGVMIKEAGKTWKEADADVCEAIDFCEYYARESVRLFDLASAGKHKEADELLLWFLPLLRMDTTFDFVQLIKLVQARVGLVNAAGALTRPPRLMPEGDHLRDTLATIDRCLARLPRR
jgi:hypothetical protein